MVFAIVRATGPLLRNEQRRSPCVVDFLLHAVQRTSCHKDGFPQLKDVKVVKQEPTSCCCKIFKVGEGSNV